VQARQWALDCLKLAVGRVRESAGEVGPEHRELLGDEKAPESKAELADGLPVACSLALLSHPVACTCDVQARSIAQLLLGIVQPGARPVEPLVARREPVIERVSQRDLQVADWLPERGGDGRVPAVQLDCRREVAVAVGEVGAQPLGAEEALKR
jgi:hypothetical protein